MLKVTIEGRAKKGKTALAALLRMVMELYDIKVEIIGDDDGKTLDGSVYDESHHFVKRLKSVNQVTLETKLGSRMSGIVKAGN